MSSFSLDDFDTHIANLQSQLVFLSETLDATDHDEPEWLATDLISLKGKTSMLCDDMRRVRKRAVSHGLDRGPEKPPNKKQRLSIEGSKDLQASNTPPSNGQEQHPLPHKSTSAQPTPQKATNPTDEYQVQYMDVTEEVNRRLRESRLRQLMESPSTAQKRKYNALDDGGVEAGEGAEDEQDEAFERQRSPTKRLKSFGHFEQVSKPREGLKRGDGDERIGGRQEVKRRKF